MAPANHWGCSDRCFPACDDARRPNPQRSPLSGNLHRRPQAWHRHPDRLVQQARQALEIRPLWMTRSNPIRTPCPTTEISTSFVDYSFFFMVGRGIAHPSQTHNPCIHPSAVPLTSSHQGRHAEMHAIDPCVETCHKTHPIGVSRDASGNHSMVVRRGH